MSQAAGFTRDQLVALSERLGEPDWMRAFRLEALARYLAAPLPDPSDEDWRHTDLRDLDLEAFSTVVSPNGTARTHQPVDSSEAAGLLVFHDGALVERRLDPECEQAGVLLCSLEQAVREHPDLVQRHFMTECVSPGETKFTLLHAAFVNSGTVCYVPRGVKVEKPLLARVEVSDGGVATLHHTLVIVDDEAQLEFVEEYQGGGEGGLLSAPVVELYAGRAAKLHFAGVQNWSHQTCEFGVQRARVGREAEVTLTHTALGTRLSKTFTGVTMAGQGATAELLGLYFPDEGQHIDTTTMQDHQVPNCTSDLLYKGALWQRAESVFRGVVRVHPDAQRTDAYQTNNNLLLGDEARADTMPVLEIQADDVKCSHGATLAHLDEEDLFYLCSRGLDRDTASRMVIAGFFEPVIARVPLASVRERLSGFIGHRISAHGDK